MFKGSFGKEPERKPEIVTEYKIVKRFHTKNIIRSLTPESFIHPEDCPINYKGP